MSYSFLESKINSLKEKPAEQWVYIKKMTDKARKEDNIKKQHRAYSLASTYSRGEQQLKYSDSLLSTAYRQNDTDIIGDCYLAKGSIYMIEERYPEALKNYLKGYDYIKKKNNPYLVHNAEYLIAQTKIYLVEYQEAQNILKNVLAFYRKNQEKINDTDYSLYYIYALISAIDTNSHLSHFEENKNLIREGMDFIAKNNYPDYSAYFISAKGIDAYHQKKYDVAIQNLNEALKQYRGNWGHLTENYYLGLSYWHKGDKNSALPYLLLLDEEYKTKGKLDPLFRPALEFLFDYYKEQGHTAKQLEYVQKVLALGKTYERDYKKLYDTLQKDYDPPKWQAEKLKLENELKQEKRRKILMSGLGIVFFSAMGLYAYSNYKRKKHYKNLLYAYNQNKSYEKENQSRIITNPDSENIGMVPELSEINPLIVENILLFLEKFEKEKKYLEKDLNIQQLAQQCGTNVSYLSKVINQYKKDNFLSYINNLRLEYVVQLWKTNPKTKHLMIQEIAHKSGFNTAQSFSKNFKEKYNISPSYFLKRLDKDEEKIQ
ncbi:helix-turn-helix domain-containing protein [Epilithonimonas xixisoli]|uniref:AraC-like DNA-binding protein n=1 Tax=Epilithonimonas xixisoli TaxID=1476462 RepID=A0A4R8I7S5_9FLAO|nr:helix-turn-helix domain-containing protein [Epilithonimonas xixisoli]TDX84505.1 AraC-like DNA-binding protein [Epilithonimonas xixisoli]